MSASSINVQIGTLGRELALDSTQLQLIAAAFFVAYASLLPIAGRLVDVWQKQRVFQLGVLGFAAGSALCAAAGNGWWLVLGRLLQGGGAALSAPAALALILTNLPAGQLRNRALGWYNAMGAIGFSLGLVLPGYVLSLFGWRASFVIFLPLAALMLPGAGGSPDTPVIAHPPLPFGRALALTLLIMLGVNALGSLGGPTAPWLIALQLALASALLAGLLLRRQSTLFPAQVLRAPAVLAACLALAAVFAAIVTSMYVTSLYLQIHGADAFEVGMALVPQSLANGIASLFGARLVTRYGSARLMVCGMLFICIGLAALAAGGLLQAYLVGLLPATVLIGVGVALCYPAASIGAINAVANEHHGSAAGLLTAWQNIGGAAGLALAGAFGVMPATSGQAPRAAMLLAIAFIAFGAATAGALLHWRRTDNKLNSPLFNNHPINERNR